ncbi:hypothetical protein FOPE_06170 [Fonsecaea pedrosoi]|nr:hypothetical protein FOPE_06170 [Fonsecaea pedrosoi]
MLHHELGVAEVKVSNMTSQPRRPIRIGNCAGAACDAGYQMYRQCTLGPIDVVTGDYLAEANLAQNAENYQAGAHHGYDPNALEGLKLSLEVAAERRIKLIVNGGALNPEGLAKVVDSMAREKKLDLKVAWLVGDDVKSQFISMLDSGVTHLDGDNAACFLTPETRTFLETPARFDIVTAHAYLGARGVKKALDIGADIIICGRVSDASPVIGAAWWWHQWNDTDYDQLAGSLVAGHLIECSGYATGGNFCEFFQFPLQNLVDIGFPIAEIDATGSSIITKHEGTRGFVTVDTLKAQLLYEIQGNIYLHSDSKANLSNVVMVEEGPNRVRVTGTKGHPPPPTTKLAAFYRAGWQCEYTLTATGYATAEKFILHEQQIRFRLHEVGEHDNFQVLEFQVYGLPETNPESQLRSTTAIRVFGQAKEKHTVEALANAMLESLLQHYAGMHGTLDWRTLVPKVYLAYCPCLIAQSDLTEAVHIIDQNGAVQVVKSGSPSKYEEVPARVDYDTESPIDCSTFGPTQDARLGDVVLARSGDKGANLNVGFFVREDDEWDWLQSILDHKAMIRLMGKEWQDEYKLERCELPGIRAVHFVIYGILKRGVSSTARLDALGKGFAEFMRDRWLKIPVKFLHRYAESRPASHKGLPPNSM